jgi:hypothetical protein
MMKPKGPENGVAFFDFANDSDVPRTKEDWDQVWLAAMDNCVKHVKAMQADSDELRIPRQLTIVQLMTIVINGCIHYDWSLDEVIARVKRHDFPELREGDDDDEAKAA